MTSKAHDEPSLTKVAALFVLSFVVTAAFSASLKVHFPAESWGVVLAKGLLPAAAHNFAADSPRPVLSALNVLASVALMGLMLYGRLRPRGFAARWAASWVALICLNMALYLYSIS